MYSTNIDGETVEFGTSGMLYHSNKLMYDRKTNTLWNQFIGEPALGPLVGSGIKLEILPVTVTTWEEWFAAHPDTTVLNPDTVLNHPEEYGPEWEPYSIYYAYRTSPGTMFPVWRQSEELPTKGQVLGLRINDQTKAYPLNSLKENPVINDSLGGENLVVVSSATGGARAYYRENHSFSLASPPDTSTAATPDGDSPSLTPAEDAAPTLMVDDGGRQWRVEEAHLVRVDEPARRLARIPSHNAYWFGWYSYYPQTAIYTP